MILIEIAWFSQTDWSLLYAGYIYCNFYLLLVMKARKIEFAQQNNELIYYHHKRPSQHMFFRQTSPYIPLVAVCDFYLK